MSSLRLCIVGCGIVSPLHVQGATQSGFFKVAVLVDLSEERRKSALTRLKELKPDASVVEFTNFEEALEADSKAAGGLFDVIALLLPHHLHQSFAERALQTRKHVLLEKPMAPSLEACDVILAAAEGRPNKDSVFMIGENSSYWPEVVKAKELVDSGAIGELLTVRANNSESLCGSMFMPEENDWHVDIKKAGSGVAMDGGLHWLRPMKVWMGNIHSVVAFTATHPGAEKYCAGETIARALIKFQNGKSGTFDATYCACPLAPQPWFVLTGAKGELAIEPTFEGGMTLYDEENPKGKKVQADSKGGYWDSFVEEYKDFGNAICNGTPLKYPPSEAKMDIKAAMAMYRSEKTGKFEVV